MAEIEEYFNKMNVAAFEATFHGLAASDEFSAIASGVGKSEDLKIVRDQLLVAGLPAEWCRTGSSVNLIVKIISEKIMRKM